MTRLALALLRQTLLEIWARPVRVIRHFFIMTFMMALLTGVATVASPDLPLEGLYEDYLLYAIIGLMGADLMWHTTVGFSDRIHEAWRSGVLDATATGPTPLWQVIFVQQFGPTFLSLGRLLVYGVMALTLRPTAMTPGGIPLTAFALALALAIFCAIGALSAAVTIALRQPDPFTRVFVALSALVSGTLFPTTHMAPLLESLGLMTPLTPLLKVMRGAILQAQTFDMLNPALLTLVITAIPAPLFFWLATQLIKRQLQSDYPDRGQNHRAH